MYEKVIPTLIFWSAFVFSIGPFWIAVMATAKTTPLVTLYRNYCIYTLVCWFPINFIIGYIVGSIGRINQDIYQFLYFIGAAVIFWMARKIATQQKSVHGHFDFNWKVMSAISWTNPKVWLTLPSGYLFATYTHSLILNIFIFFLLGMPLFLVGVSVWAMIGRQAVKIAKDKINYVNAALLIAFGLYLIYEGIQLMNAR